MSEFTSTRLRALLQALSVTQLSRRQRLRWWLWTVLQCMIAGSLVVALSLKPTAIQPAITYDETGRQFLLSYPLASFATLASAIYIVASFAHFGSGMLAAGRARRGPPPDMALALRQATYARDPRIAPVAQGAQPTLDPALGSAYPNSSLAVAAPDLLAEPLLATIGMLALGIIPLWFADTLAPGFAQFPDHGSLWMIGILLMLSALAFAYARHCWNSWRAGSRGVPMTASAEGLAIRAPETLGGRRFIPWRSARSLARLTYSYSGSGAHTVYMLDAGDQTLLWECPPGMRYASPTRRAKIAQQQFHGAWLVALVATATGLPPLDISEIVHTITNLAPIDITASDDGGIVAVEVSPTAEDSALLEFLSSAGAETANSDAPSPPPTPGDRLEQWRRFLNALLFWFTSLLATIWFLHRLTSP